ncbi:hypothetical protein JHK87_029344 [Glycine soja]|nr:hypothetical protein JHK87_029344 [Glycine soja]
MDSSSSFSSLRAYLNALSHTPTRLAQRALSVSTSYDEMSQVRSRSGTSMRKTLRWFDLVGLGIGGMVGAGVFVTTGHATRYAGPAHQGEFGGQHDSDLAAHIVYSVCDNGGILESYIGYDAVSTMAEEVRDPVKDIPVGVSGSVVIVTVLYCLMAASMTKLLPYDMINAEAPFSAAFSGRSDGWGWISGVIGVGASFGILTSLLVAMLGQARYMCVIGRSNVVPSWFARVHPKTSTPVNASAFLGIFTAAIALFTDLDVLLNLVSIGTLFVFYMVANAVIYRRYVATGTTNPWPTLSFLCSFSITAIMFTLIWKFVPTGGAKAGMLSVSGVIAIAILQLFHCMVPQVRKPEFWGVPFMPWIPSISIFLNVFLLGSLDGPSYVRFGFFSAVAVLFYVFYSVHASFDAAGDGSLTAIKNGEIHVESKEIEDQISFKV